MAKRKTSAKKTKRSEQKPSTKPVLVGILLITALLFAKSITYDFVNWDDDVNLLDNARIQAFTWENIKGIFTERIIGNYNPLPIFTFAIEHALFGMNATVFHLNNVLLHLVNVALVFFLGRQLGLKLWTTAALALLFGIHPLRVESVAWITERKDVLFAAFYFGALLLYTRRIKAGKSGFSPAIFCLFMLSLFSKIQAVSLPLSMLCIDYYLAPQLNNRAFTVKLWLGKWWLFALSLVFGLGGLYFLEEAGSLEDASDYSVFERLLVGPYSYLVYLIKSIIPYQLSPLYPYPRIIPVAFYGAPVVVAAVVGVVIYAWRQNWRSFVFGTVFFTVNIIFLLQMLNAGQGFLADRFTYVAYFGLFFMLAFYMQLAIEKYPQRRTVLIGGFAVWMLALSVLTFRQISVWKNGATLWTHVDGHFPNITTAVYNLGHYFRDSGQSEQALEYYTEALARNTKKAIIWNSRGKLFFDLGNDQNALNDYNRAIELDQSVAEFYANRGAVNGRLNNLDDARSDLSRALELDPTHTNSYLNRSILYSMKQDFPNALNDVNAYLRLVPDDADLWSEKGYLHAQIGARNEALAALKQAQLLAPNNGNVFVISARTQRILGNTAQMKQDLLKAQQLNTPIPPDLR